MTGQLTCVVGPMFSGKTTWLLETLQSTEKGAKCLVITHATDNRYTNELVICTHNRRTAKAQKVNSLSEIPQSEVDAHAAVFIDEGHFFQDLVEYTDQWATLGKRVYVGMLNGTFRREPFTGTARMFSIAEKLVSLKTDCSLCGEKGNAGFTQRKIADEKELLVGGEDLYAAVCRRCYFAILP